MFAFFGTVQSSMFMKIKVLLVLMLVVLTGCTSFRPYRMEIRQGNLVTPEMRAKVRVGMSRQQVTAALGSPLVSDVFHANRWDYLYRYDERGKPLEQQRLTVYFEGDFVKRIDDSQMAGAGAQPATAGK